MYTYIFKNKYEGHVLNIIQRYNKVQQGNNIGNA